MSDINTCIKSTRGRYHIGNPQPRGIDLLFGMGGGDGDGSRPGGGGSIRDPDR